MNCSIGMQVGRNNNTASGDRHVDSHVTDIALNLIRERAKANMPFEFQVRAAQNTILHAPPHSHSRLRPV